MCTPVILADRFPSATHDTPTSTCHVAYDEATGRSTAYHWEQNR